MKSVILGPDRDPVLVRTNRRLLDAFVEGGGTLTMACGGKGLCATCHVYVDAGADQLSPVTPREEMSLQMLAQRKPNSRLACQAKVRGEGVRLVRPRGLYVSSDEDLETYEALIGRRAEEPILHPINGRVLVGSGKLITRSRIRELQSAKGDIGDLQTRTISHGRVL